VARLSAGRHAALARAELDVLHHRQPGKQRVALEHHAAVGAGAGDGPAVEGHGAGGRPVEAGDDAQQRGLAATRGAEDGDEIALAHRQVDGRQRLHRIAAAHAREGARDALDDDAAHIVLQGNSFWFTALNRKSEIRPMTPMTMMPKIIWPVASSAWLSMIMWPMPEDEPMSSATMT
jgi:hypothetical protein